jgi:phosphatidate phosphatase APP1
MARPEIEALVNFSERSARQSLLMQLAPLTGEYDVSVKPVKPTRSGRQNRYYFSVCCRLYAQYETDQGNDMNKDGAHEFFKDEFGLRHIRLNRRTGKRKAYLVSTTNYTVEDFSTYLDHIIRFLSGLDIYVPDPSEYGIEVSHAY